MSTRLPAANTCSREEAARNALALENAQSLANAIALSEELRASNVLLRQELELSVQSLQSVPPHTQLVPSPSGPFSQRTSPLQIPADISLLEMQLQLDTANKRLREFEDQAELARKRTALREELALITQKLFDLENSVNLPVLAPLEVYSSSSNGVNTFRTIQDERTIPLETENSVAPGMSIHTQLNSTPTRILGHTGLSNQLGGAPPEKAAPTGTVTFYDKDNIPYYTMEKRTAEIKIRDQLGLRRALDSERKLTFLGNELLEFKAQFILDKLISYGLRMLSLTMSAGDSLEAKDYEPTWNSCRKICEEAIYSLPVFQQIEKLERLLNWKFSFRCYTDLSLYHFCKGGSFDESNRALVVDALRRDQEVMSIIFGESFRDVFTKYINDIMDTHSLYDGEYLRYMAEEVLYRYGVIMSDTWSATQADFIKFPMYMRQGTLLI